MHDDRLSVQQTKTVQLIQLVPTRFIRALGQVNEEWITIRRSLEVGFDILAEVKGVAPAITFQYSDREPIFKNIGFVLVVMAYGGYSAEQVFEPAPEESSCLGNL